MDTVVGYYKKRAQHSHWGASSIQFQTGMSLTPYRGKRTREYALGPAYSDYGLGLSPGATGLVDRAVTELANRAGRYATPYINKAAAWLHSGSKRSKPNPSARPAVPTTKAGVGYKPRSRVMPYPRKRKRSFRKKSYKKRGGRKAVTKSKYGRTANLTAMVGRIPPNAISFFSKSSTISGQLFNNLDAAEGISTRMKNWVIRANDVINPCCVNGDEISPGGAVWKTNWTDQFRTSALGVNRIAPMYKEHVVQKFTYNIRFTFRWPTAKCTAQLEAVFCWRISDDAPVEVNRSTVPSDMINNVVHQRMTGWRYKRMKFSNVAQRTLKIRGSIPISKFYRYPLFTRDEQAAQMCTTPTTTPNTWTSPTNPCYMQYCFFIVDNVTASEARVPDYIDDALAAVATSVSSTNSWYVPYSITTNFGFLVRSTERDQDILNQSTTTDGGADADGDEQLAAISSTWTGHDEDDIVTTP